MVLSGIKVVEVFSLAAAPSCGVWLAEFGADVTRVEPIDGGPVRGVLQTGFIPLSNFNWVWELWNRSKRGIAVDLHQKQGRVIIRKLRQAIEPFVEYYNHQRYHESHENVTPADVHLAKVSISRLCLKC